MGGETQYRVVLDLSTRGDLSAKIGTVGAAAGTAHGHVTKLGHAAREVGEAVESMGHRLGGFLEGIADRAAEVGLHFGKLAGLGVIGIAAYGVGKLNDQLEQTQISLGAIANAQGFADTFEKGFQLAGDQLAKMKQDVKTLPGDLGQLSDIMKMIATPAAHGGANLDQIRKLAGQTMLTSTILGVPQDVAAREMAGLLSGRAGSHNILGGRMGLLGAEAHKFNALSPENRLARINTEIAKYSGAADKFGTSFVAQWTTLKDNIKYGMVAEGTDELFGRVKNSMAELNSYIDEHKDKIKEVVDTVGHELANAWDRVAGGVKIAFGEAQKLFTYLKDLPPGAIMGAIKHTGEGLLGAKLAGMGLEAGGSMIGGGLSMFSKILPMLGGGGAAGAGGAGALASALPIAGVAMGALAADAVVLGGAIDVLADKTNAYHDVAQSLADDTMVRLKDSFERVKTDAEPAIGALKTVADTLGVAFLGVLDFGVKAIDDWIIAFEGMGHLIHEAAVRLGLAGSKLGPTWAEPIMQNEQEFMPRLLSSAAMRDLGVNHKVAPKDVHLHVGNIVIEVKGSDDPSRVARLTVDTLKNWARNPTRSPGVPNYESARHT